MTETLSVRIDGATKQRLDALSRQSKRSKSFLAAEAIAAYVEREEWQIGEIRAAIEEVDAERTVPHEKVAGWLKSWGTTKEKKAPR
jgi:RHH-type rel operon transcriptional repressor/antitoxin RelB